MRKKSLLKIILIIIVCLINVRQVNAITLKDKDGKNYNISNINKDQKITYDIENILFDMDDREITIEGWATAHHQNNWGGVYSTISIGLAYEGQIPQTFYEVDTYVYRNFFGNHCNSNKTFCKDWKMSGGDEKKMKTAESGGVCSTTDKRDEKYGCIYRNVGFKTNIDISGYADDKEINIYLMVTYTKTNKEANSKITNSSLINSGVNVDNDYSNGNSKYNVYTSNNVEANYKKIGVDVDSCDIKGNNKTNQCNSGEMLTASNYIITIDDISKKLKDVTSGNLIPANSVEYKNLKYIFKVGDQINRPDVPDWYTYSEERIGYKEATINGTLYQFPNSLKIKYYKIAKSSNGEMIGLWIPASWVEVDGSISFKIKPAKTCVPTDKNQKLTCSNPETSYSIFEDSNTNCIQTFTTNGGSVNVKFTQKGIIKIGLHNTYIKSGQAFSLDASYTDTVTWQLVDVNGKNCNNCYSYSTNLSAEQQKNVRKDLLNQIRDYLKKSELFTNSKAEFYFYYEPKKNNKLNDQKRYLIGGTWSLEKNKETYANTFVSTTNTNISSGSVTINANFELCDSYSNINVIDENGVEHKYVCPSDNGKSNPDDKKYIYNGQLFYTDLDLPSDYYTVTGSIKGLSALKYQNYNDTNKDGYVWSVEYECGIECYQGYYGNVPSTIDSDNDSGYYFSYREIDITEPFPISSGTLRAIDENWLSWAEFIGRRANANLTKKDAEYAGLGFDGEKYTYGLTAVNGKLMGTISGRLSETYKAEPEYVVTLNKNNILKIKKYNTTHNYIDITYAWSVGQTVSQFLQTAVKEGYFESFKRANDYSASKVGECGANNTDDNSLYLNNCFCPLQDKQGNCIYNGGVS